MVTDPIPPDIEAEIGRLKRELVRMVLFEVRADDATQFAGVRAEISQAIGSAVSEQLASAVPGSALAAAGSAIEAAGARATELAGALDTILNKASTARDQTTQLSDPLSAMGDTITSISEQLTALSEQAGQVQQLCASTAGGVLVSAPTKPAPLPVAPPVPPPAPTPAPPPTEPTAESKTEAETKPKSTWEQVLRSLGGDLSIWAAVVALLVTVIVFAWYISGPAPETPAQVQTKQSTRNLAGTLVAAGARLDERIRVAAEPAVTNDFRLIGPPMGRVSATNLAESLNEVARIAEDLAGTLPKGVPPAAVLGQIAAQLTADAAEVRGYAETGKSTAQWAPGELLATSTRLRGIAERQLALQIESVIEGEMRLEPPSPTPPTISPSPTPSSSPTGADG